MGVAFSMSSPDEENQRSVYEMPHREFSKELAGEINHRRIFSPPSHHGPNRQNVRVHATSLGVGDYSPNSDSPAVWTAELAG